MEDDGNGGGLEGEGEGGGVRVGGLSGGGVWLSNGVVSGAGGDGVLDSGGGHGLNVGWKGVERLDGDSREVG